LAELRVGTAFDADRALARMDAINDFLRQPMHESTPPVESWARLSGLVADGGAS